MVTLPAFRQPSRVHEYIHLIRGLKVMLDVDLAGLYGVPTKRQNEQVRRNRSRFPDEFMFQLSAKEFTSLRSQSATSKRGRGGTRFPPFAFTEQGVAMLSSVLSSDRAIRVNIEIMRAFVRFRQMMESNTELSKRLSELEKRYDGRFAVVFRAIKELMSSPEKPKRTIGY